MDALTASCSEIPSLTSRPLSSVRSTATKVLEDPISASSKRSIDGWHALGRENVVGVVGGVLGGVLLL
jgi:hypothetical protein